MGELVDNLVDFARARLGGGMLAATARQDALATDLQHVVDELTAISEGRRIEFQADLAAPVTCDRSRIAQMLSNLLGNALRHGDAGGPITVRARSTEEVFELSVANSGRPIPAEVRARLFEPFFRGPANARSEEGLGLGLFIVGEIARVHGGRMDVASDERETRFTFVMPQRNAGASPVPGPGQA
jgi:signal transduction histidine kinase